MLGKCHQLRHTSPSHPQQPSMTVHAQEAQPTCRWGMQWGSLLRSSSALSLPALNSDRNELNLTSLQDTSAHNLHSDRDPTHSTSPTHPTTHTPHPAPPHTPHPQPRALTSAEFPVHLLDEPELVWAKWLPCVSVIQHREQQQAVTEDIVSELTLRGLQQWEGCRQH